MKINIDDDELIELIQKHRPKWPLILCEELAQEMTSYEWALKKQKGDYKFNLGIECLDSLLNTFQLYPDIRIFARAHFLTLENAKERLKEPDATWWFELNEAFEEYLIELAENTEGLWLIRSEVDSLIDEPFLLGGPSFEHLTITKES